MIKILKYFLDIIFDASFLGGGLILRRGMRKFVGGKS